MCLYLYIHSKKNISRETLGEKLKNYCHIEYSFFELIQINSREDSFEFLFIFSKNTIFYEDNSQLHRAPNNTFNALQGYCWDKYGGETTRPKSTKALQALIEKSPSDIRSVQSSLSGEYSTISRLNDGKIVSFNDNFGIENVFYHKNDDLFVISNREDFVRIAASIRNNNYTTLCQLPLSGYRLLDEGINQLINKLPPGGVLTFTPSDGVKVDDKHPIYLGKDPMTFMQKNKYMDELIEAGIEEVKSNLYAVKNTVDSIPLGLTGGKDSRLTLAFCHAFGLDKNLDLFTNGHPELPDVRVAKNIADIFSLRHKVNSPSFVTSSLPYIGAEELFHRIAVQVFQTDSSFSVWDLKSRGNSGHGIELSGFSGEVLKTYIKKPIEINRNSSPKDFIGGNGIYDPLGIISERVKKQINTSLKEKLWAYTELGYNYEDIPDLYYALIRLPQWLGAARFVGGYSIQSVSILNSSSLSQLAMNLPAKERRMELIHYELIKKLSPKLLTIPFAMQKWHKGLSKYGASSEIFTDPVTPRINIPSAGSWQFLLNENPFFRRLVIELVESNSSLEIWEYIDFKKLLKLLKNKVFTHFELISLYGLITVFFRDSDLIIPSKLGFHNTNKHHQVVSIKSKESGIMYALENNKLLINKEPTELAKHSSIPVSGKCLKIIFNERDNLDKRKNIKWVDTIKNIIGINRATGNLNFRGYLEKRNITGVSGWVFCQEFPKAKLSLDIIINNKLTYQITANLFRKDLKDNRIGDGNHAFSFLFSPVYEGQIDLIQVKVSGSKYVLPETTHLT